MTKSNRSEARASRSLPGADLLVLGLFFFSGASALIYEVVWSRGLTFVFGGTAFAIATVLAAYMAGLAAGSWIFGRRIDRGGHPIVVYALLEAGIAVWALVLPSILSLLNGFYGLLYRGMNPDPYVLSLIRFALCFLVLLVPTILMGGTLPVLTKLLVGARQTIGLKTGLLYGTNVAGAVAGTAAAGFLLIPGLGMRAATWVAILFNLAVALFAFLLRRALPRPAPPDGEEPGDVPAAGVRPQAGLRKAVLLVYAASGFAALAYEVAWTKVLSGVLGTTTYAFSAMLTTFLLGLALGSFLMARLADRHDPARLLAWSQLMIAAFGLAALPLFNELPILFIQVYRSWGGAWKTQTLAKFLLCAITMLPPTILMGGAFPLVARIYTGRLGRLGTQVGELYSANTVGAILGSFAAGFILIPLLGRQGTILTAALVNVLSGVLLYVTLGRSLSLRARLAAGATAAAVLVAAFFGARPWDRFLLSSGAYVYADAYSREKDLRQSLHNARLVFFEEDTEAILAVYRSSHVLSLRTNGKVEASTSGDMLTQKMISHLPLLHHKKPDDVLMIGLASGISLGSVLAYQEVRKADCVEMLEGMTRASEQFRKYNRDCLKDPRTRLIINDGRNHLMLTRDAYDVIISQPSNPWIVGIGSLFTREFFEIGARRLKPGGIFCQWIQMYQMSRRDFGSVLRTFREVFPRASLWMGSPGDIILLGSHDPIGLDYQGLCRDIARPVVAEDLATVGVRDAYGFLQGYLGGAASLDALTTGAGPVITDDNLLLEFSMPRNLYAAQEEMMSLPVLVPGREPAATAVSLQGIPPDSAERVSRTLASYHAARAPGLEGIDQSFSQQFDTAVPLLEQALAGAPTDPLFGHYIASCRNEVGIRLLQGGQERQAILEFSRAAQVGSPSEKALALNNIGLHHYTAGRVDSAGAFWQRAADLEPENPIIRYNLALVHDGNGRPDLAEKEYRAVLELEPDNSVALNNLAWILVNTPGRAGEAVDLSARAVAIDPSPGNLDTHGLALLEAGRLGEAESALRRAIETEPGNMEAWLHLGDVLARAGRTAEARAALEKVAQNNADLGLAERARQKLVNL